MTSPSSTAIEVEQMNALSYEVISRQATINIGCIGEREREYTIMGEEL
jgi:hypothetical protein